MTPGPVRAQGDELKELLAAATPGPWTLCGEDNGVCQCGQIHAHGYFVGRLLGGENMGDDECPTPEYMRANARLVVALRNAAPSLLAALAERDEARFLLGDAQLELRELCKEVDRATGGDDTTKGAKKTIHNIGLALEASRSLPLSDEGARFDKWCRERGWFPEANPALKPHVGSMREGWLARAALFAPATGSGLERAAKWHEDRAAECEETEKRDAGSCGFWIRRAGAHREDAACIRRLAETTA